MEFSCIRSDLTVAARVDPFINMIYNPVKQNIVSFFYATTLHYLSTSTFIFVAKPASSTFPLLAGFILLLQNTISWPSSSSHSSNFVFKQLLWKYTPRIMLDFEIIIRIYTFFYDTSYKKRF